MTVKEPIDPSLEEIVIGDYSLYLNHSDREIKLTGYDLLEERNFDTVEKYGVVLMENK